MLIEGRGIVAPSREVVILSPSDVEFVRMVAEARNTYRRYQQRSDSWGRGMVSNAAFVGTLGELAVCSYLNRRAGCRLEIDTKLRPYGDRGIDLTTDGIGIGVKTRQPNSKNNLFRRVDSQKRLVPLRCEFHVFCRRESDREIQIIGWISSLQMRQTARSVRSNVGDWWNLLLDDSDLQPMSRIVEEIKLVRSM